MKYGLLSLLESKSYLPLSLAENFVYGFEVLRILQILCMGLSYWEFCV